MDENEFDDILLEGLELDESVEELKVEDELLDSALLDDLMMDEIDESTEELKLEDEALDSALLDDLMMDELQSEELEGLMN